MMRSILSWRSLGALCVAAASVFGGCGSNPDKLDPMDVRVTPDASVAGRAVQVDLAFVPASEERAWESKPLPQYFGGGDDLRRNARIANKAVTLQWNPGETGAKTITLDHNQSFWAAAEETGSANLLVLAQVGGIDNTPPIWRLTVPMGEGRWDKGPVEIMITSTGPSLPKQPNKVKD